MTSSQQAGDNVVKKVLSNGLTVLMIEDHTNPVVAINVWIKVGSVNETEEMAGLAHFQEHMVFKGSEKYGVGEIANLVKSAGGNLNASTSYSYTMYYVVLPSRAFSLGLAVQADAMLHSTFDPNEFKKERIVVVDEARMYDDQPEAFTFYRTMELGFKFHNYRRPIAGYEKVISNFNREQLIEFYRTYYRPSNAVLVVVGDIDPSEALVKIEEIYGEWEDRTAKVFEPPREPEQEEFRFKVHKGSIDHAYTGIGFHIPDILHEDYPALQTLATLLGSGKSSRLYQNVLEDKHLVTTIDVKVLAEKWPGFFQIYAAMPMEKWAAAQDAIFVELQKFKREPIREDEMLKARRQLQKSIYSELETVEGQASNLGYYELLGDYRLAEKHREAIRKVTADEVANVAGKYFDLRNCSIVLYMQKDADIAGLSQHEVEGALGEKLLGTSAVPTPHASGQQKGSSERGDSYCSTSKRSTGEAKSRMKLIALDTGLRVLVKKRQQVPLVSVVTIVQGGARLEPKGRSGLSLLTLRSLLKGTASFTAEDIPKAVEGFGGSIESFSSFDTGGVYINILSEYLDSILPVYKEIVRSPTFLEDAVQKEKEKLLEELAKRRDNPFHFGIDNLFEKVFGDHPYSYPFLGEAKQVEEATADDCRRWYTRILVPENIVVCFVGDITEERAVGLAEELFGDLGKNTGPVPETEAPEIPVYPGRHELARENIKQSVALAGFTAPPMMSEEAISLEVLNGILTGLGGRLFVELRDKRSLGYMAGSAFLPFKDRSMFFGYANPTADGVDEALKVILDELITVTQEAVSKEELERAKKWLIGTQIMRLQRNLSQAVVYGTYEVLGFGYDTVDRMPEIIQSVAEKSIMKAAAGVFGRERAVLIKLVPDK